MFKWVVWACLGLGLCAGSWAQAVVPATLVNDTDRVWNLVQNRLVHPLVLDVTEPEGQPRRENAADLLDLALAPGARVEIQALDPSTFVEEELSILTMTAGNARYLGTLALKAGPGQPESASHLWAVADLPTRSPCPGYTLAVQEAGWCAIRRRAAPEEGKDHREGPSASKRARFDDADQASSSTRPCACFGPHGLVAALPLDLAYHCAPFLDEFSCAALDRASSANHRLVKGPETKDGAEDKVVRSWPGLRRESRRTNLEPVRADLDRPETRCPDYKGCRHIRLASLPPGRVGTVLEWLGTATEVETLTIAGFTHCPSVAQLMRLRAIPTLTSLVLACPGARPSKPEAIERARAFLRQVQPAPAALTTLRIDPAWEFGCRNLDLAPLLEDCPLRTLNLAACPLVPGLAGRFRNHLEALLRAKAGTLQSLTLGTTDLGDRDLRTLSRWIRGLPGLEHLALEDADEFTEGPAFATRVHDHLGRSLAALPRLRTFVCQALAFTEDVDADCAFLLNLPLSLQALRDVNGFMTVRGAGEKVLSPVLLAALERLPELREISMFNAGTLAETALLVSALSAKPSLRVLTVQMEGDPRDPGLEAGLEALRQDFRRAGKELRIEFI
jgi:hypothetical protein